MEAELKLLIWVWTVMVPEGCGGTYPDSPGVPTGTC